MYQLDTNTLIYFFKNMGQVAKNLLQKNPRHIFVSSLVVYELEVGIEKSTQADKRRQQLEDLLKSISLVSFGVPEARRAAKIRARLEKMGQPIGPVDVLIVASALASNHILVTRNTDEFSRVPNLKMENWF